MILDHNPIEDVPPPLPIPTDHFRLQTSRIAGLEYHHINDVSDQLQPGTELTLIPEPANPHEKYAVRIQHNETLLGYLPRSSNHITSRLLRQKAPLKAQVAYLSKTQPHQPTILPIVNNITIHILLKKHNHQLPPPKKSVKSAPIPSENPC